MSDMAVDYALRPISVEDYHRMARAGIFGPEERVELIDGELIAVPPMGSSHGGAIGAITMLLTSRLMDRALVRVQCPVIVGAYSEPEPDFAIVPLAGHEWRERHPVPADVLLIIEVSNSTRNFDLNKKTPMYARGGVKEVWIVDIPERRIVVHRDPKVARFTVTRVVGPGDTLSPAAFPTLVLDADVLLGPQGRPAARN